MNRILYLIYILCVSVSFSYAQELNFKSVRPKKIEKDSVLSRVELYKIINVRQDTTYIDTTLTISRAYKHNFLQKDLFEWQPMANKGSVLQNLSVPLFKKTTAPSIGASANTPYLLKGEDLPYYYLPAPITEFHFKTAMEQGQMLHTLFSANINPELNIFVKYNALRSDGKYQRSYNSIGSFVIGGGYASKNRKYFANGYYSYQNLEREENGGLQLLEQFTSGDKQFLNRANIDIKLLHARSYQLDRRFFLQHSYNFVRKDAAINTQVLLKHTFEYASANYAFSENLPTEEVLSARYVTGRTFDQIHLKELTNKLGTELILPYLGRSFIYGKSYNYHYFLEKRFIKADGSEFPSKISHTDYGLGLFWRKNYKGFSLNVEAEQMFIGKFLGSFAMADVSFKIQDDMKLKLGAKLTSVKPNLNKLLFLSDYKSYNWNNINSFDNERTQSITGELYTPWVVLLGEISNKWNYTVFRTLPTDEALIPELVPYQEANAIQYYKLKAHKELSFGRFALDNTLVFQGVGQGHNVLHLPTFLTRNSLYYQGFVFKKAMFLQTGVTFKYFTDYYADAYNPLLAEWAVQNTTKVGNYPTFDFFLNAKVRTMRIYFTVEHFNAGFSKRNYFSSPTYPYRDLSVRLGLSWNFFS